MKFKGNTGITWSLLELTGILEDEDSYVTFERIKKHFGLHPFHLTNLQSALNEILSSNLNSYDPELNGFVIAYKNPTLLTPLGEIVYDTCFIHVDIEADFYVFRPKVECHLKGIVNKKGFNHIGVLVHKAFNVSIPRPENEEEDWPGDNVHIGQEIKFMVTQLDFNGRLPFIRGSLNRENYLQNCKLNTTSDDLRNEDTYIEGPEDENTVTEKIERVSQKNNSKKCKYTNEDFETPELRKKEKQEKKRSKRLDKNHVGKFMEYDTATTSSQRETDDTEEDSFSRNYNMSQFNDTVPLLNETDGERSKKRTKRSKVSKRFSDTENQITIKTEKTSSLDGSLENIAEINTSKKKAKRKDVTQSRHVNNENHEEANENETSEREKSNSVKRHTKKSKETDFDFDPKNIAIKPEIQVTYNSLSNEETNEEINTTIKSKKKSKKAKESEYYIEHTPISIKSEINSTYDATLHEEPLEEAQTISSPRKKSRKHNDKAQNPESPKKRSKRSDTLESPLEFECIKIKIEKDTNKQDNPEEDHIEAEASEINYERENETIPVSQRSAESGNRNIEKSSKRKSKKSTKRTNIEYEDSTIIIKSENLDDNMFKEEIQMNSKYTSTPARKGSPTKKNVHSARYTQENSDNTAAEVNCEENVNNSINRVKVKTEDCTSGNEIEENLQKSRTKSRLSSRRKVEETSSPKKKHSKKSRTSDSEFDFSNVTIKVEQPTDE